MEIKVRKEIWMVQEILGDVKFHLDKAQSLNNSNDKITGDKIKWALSKVGDLERLLSSLNPIK